MISGSSDFDYIGDDKTQDQDLALKKLLSKRLGQGAISPLESPSSLIGRNESIDLPPDDVIVEHNSAIADRPSLDPPLFLRHQLISSKIEQLEEIGPTSRFAPLVAEELQDAVIRYSSAEEENLWPTLEIKIQDEEFGALRDIGIRRVKEVAALTFHAVREVDDGRQLPTNYRSDITRLFAAEREAIRAIKPLITAADFETLGDWDDPPHAR